MFCPFHAIPSLSFHASKMPNWRTREITTSHRSPNTFYAFFIIVTICQTQCSGQELLHAGGWMLEWRVQRSWPSSGSSTVAMGRAFGCQTSIPGTAEAYSVVSLSLAAWLAVDWASRCTWSCHIHIMTVWRGSQLKVMNNKLFSVEPKKGRLLSGESCTVTLTYQHSMIDTDRVPVVFKLNRGRQILVRLSLMAVCSLINLVPLSCCNPLQCSGSVHNVISSSLSQY